MHLLTPEKQLCVCLFFNFKDYIIWGGENTECNDFILQMRAVPDILPVPQYRRKLLEIKVYRRFAVLFVLFVLAGESARAARRDCNGLDTRSDRRAFV